MAFFPARKGVAVFVNREEDQVCCSRLLLGRSNGLGRVLFVHLVTDREPSKIRNLDPYVLRAHFPSREEEALRIDVCWKLSGTPKIRSSFPGAPLCQQCPIGSARVGGA